MELNSSLKWIEIFRLLFALRKTRVAQLRSPFLAGMSWSSWVLKHHIKDIMVTISLLAQDTTQLQMEQKKTKVVTLEHGNGGAQPHQRADAGLGEQHQGEPDGCAKCFGHRAASVVGWGGVGG